MTLWEILETLIIGPLKLVFEWIFHKCILKEVESESVVK